MQLDRSVGMTAVGVLIATVIGCCLPGTHAADGLYVSNGTDILFLAYPISDARPHTSVYNSEQGRIVGLAYDIDSKLLFWSDVDMVQRGIYQATINSNGSIGPKTSLVDFDIMEVNGLTVDWKAKNLYWTDSRKQTIEVVNFNTTSFPRPRRVLVMDRLFQPRGIYADPINGYLFWNDQGNGSIERSGLDGSNRQRIVGDTKWPNQMTVHDGLLYWVDSSDKTLRKCNLEGQGRSKVADLATLSADKNIFGLAIHNGLAYVTSWIQNQVLQVELRTGTTRIVKSGLGIEALFSAVFYSASVQSASLPSLCSMSRCSHLCLPVSNTRVRCSCPSFGGLVLRDEKNCRKLNSTDKVLLYAVADSGYVGFHDPQIPQSQLPVYGERYLIGRSLRPVGVAYDPTKQIVYWSDVSERTIHRVNFDGTNPLIFLGGANGLGVVDGLALDHVHRLLYYTHIGVVRIEGVDYTWQKIETVMLDAPFTVRTIVDTAEKPRALALDIRAGYLYYSDWGNRARIMRTNLDGSEPRELRSGLNNPNGLALVGGRLYLTESHYKTRTQSYSEQPQNGSLYSMNVDGSDWKKETKNSYSFVTPFGLTYDGSDSLYVSDWDRRVVVSLRVDGTRAQSILEEVDYPMMLLHTPYSVPAEPNPCSTKGCSDVCLKTPAGPVCRCNSYSTKALGVDKTACKPKSDGFLVVGDMNSLKMYSLDGTDQSVYTAVQGQPYFSNIVAVTYDNTTNTLYYSDINSKWIMAMKLDGNTTGGGVKFFESNHIIDGMTVDVVGRKLYWSDSLQGQILSVGIMSNGSAGSDFSTVVSDLNRPRALRISGGYLYWTEWGDTAANRVSKKAIGGHSSGIVSVISSSSNVNIKWPNGIFIDERSSKLYVSDGHPDKKTIYRCTLLGADCQELPGLKGHLQHVYDIWVYKEIVYFSDWRSRAVIAYSERQNTSWPVLQGLMRPSQIFIKYPRETTVANYCTGKSDCSDICVPLLGGRSCACNANRVLSPDDQKSCKAASAECKIGDKSYKYGEKFLPIAKTPCLTCQCLAGSTAYNDPTYGGGTKCERIDTCPSLTCGGDESVTNRENLCCPVCVVECGVKITNCPPGVVTLALPDNQEFVFYDYLPSVKDCKRLSREIKFTRDPLEIAYAWKDSVQVVTMKASVVGGTDTATCTFSINVTDNTPPSITCPSSSVLNTLVDRAIGRWTQPQVSDNTRTDSLLTECKPKWGSELPVGMNTVTCSVKDRSHNEAKCNFTIDVKNETNLQCFGTPLPLINSGQFKCNTDSNQLSCDISCVEGYRKVKDVGKITCVDQEWKPIYEHLGISTCKKWTNLSAIGNLTIIAKGACRDSIRLSFTTDSLHAKIRKDYLWRSLYPLKSTVTATGCSGGEGLTTGNGDVKVDIVLSGLYSRDDDPAKIKADIDKILQLIKIDLDKGFLNLAVADSYRVRTVMRPIVDISAITEGCLAGSIPEDAGCVLCPPGMYTINKGQCLPCQNDTYNENDGQTQCQKCPDNGTSPEGAYVRYLCEPRLKLSCDLWCWIRFVAPITGGVLLILLVVVIVLCITLGRRRARDNVYITHPAASKPSTSEYRNKCFTEDHENNDNNEQVYEDMREEDCSGGQATSCGNGSFKPNTDKSAACESGNSKRTTMDNPYVDANFMNRTDDSGTYDDGNSRPMVSDSSAYYDINSKQNPENAYEDITGFKTEMENTNEVTKV